MKIVVLDGFTLNPGDLSWDALKALGSCQIYDRTPEAGFFGARKFLSRFLSAATYAGRKALKNTQALNHADVAADKKVRAPITYA